MSSCISKLESWIPKTHFTRTFNKYVDWTAANAARTIQFANNLKIEPALHGILAKVSRVFFAIFTSAALLPLALIACTKDWIGENLLSKRACNPSVAAAAQSTN